MQKITNYYSILVLFFFSFFFFLFNSSCSKDDSVPREENIEKLALIKSAFETAQENYSKSISYSSLSFRQSLKRNLNWGHAEFINDTLYVPVSLILPDSLQSNGNIEFLVNSVWMRAVDGGNELEFEMVTLLPNGLTDVQFFSGKVIYEDYFLGNPRFSSFTEGKLVRNSKIITKYNSSKKSKREVDCINLPIGEVCVGHPTNSEEPEICTTKYERVCRETGDGGGGGGLPPPSGGGGGSGGSSSTGVNPDAELFIPSHDGEIIVNINDYLKCYSSTKGKMTLTIYVDQPKPGKRDTWSGVVTQPDVGHTFIGINQNGVTRILGFYPSEAVSLKNPEKGAALVDDSKHEYNVSISYEVSTDKISQLLSAIKNYRKTYNLNSFNCTNFAMEMSAKAGVTLPSTIGEWGNFIVGSGKGNNPGDMGEDLRKFNSTGVTKKTNYGIAPSNSGTCN